MRAVGVRFGFVQRSRGQCATARSSYQRDRFIVGRTTQVFIRHDEEHLFGAVFLPEDAPAWASEPVTLWQGASAAERRRDAVEARTLEVSLPRELPTQNAIAAMSDLAAWFRDLGLCVQLDLHDGEALDGGRNPHAHLMISTRSLTSTGFENRKSEALEQAFRRDRGRWLRQHISNVINKAGRETLKQDVVYSGPLAKLTPPEPRLPRWQAKSWRGCEFLYMHRLLPRLDELVVMEQRLQNEIDNIAEAVGDIDWFVSGYLGHLRPAWESDADFRMRTVTLSTKKANFHDEGRLSWNSEDDGFESDIELEQRDELDSDRDVEPPHEVEPGGHWQNEDDTEMLQDWSPDEINEY
jgi:MobA/MobL family